MKAGKFQVKIGDLGFSKQLRDSREEMLTYCGTPLNMAPEVINRKPYTYKADIWSVGVIIFVLLTGYYPFFANDKSLLKMKLDRGLYSISKQVNITPVCLDFIHKCLQYNPDKRIDWAQIEQHPFYVDRHYYRRLERLSFSFAFEQGHY